VELATAALGADHRVAVRQADLASELPLPSASLDLVYSNNLLECLPDPVAFAREVARVLRPGGQVVIGHWDWDSQLFDGSDKEIIRRLIAAYADWQQSWMAHADGWMGRRLAGLFRAIGAFDGGVRARVLLNSTYEPGHFGFENAQALAGPARRALASPSEYEWFLEEQARLAREGRYFYSITGFAYVGYRHAA
jgi:SAM-dependent methyltransferase